MDSFLAWENPSVLDCDRMRFYITTAIDYPNGRPHMGHAYEKVITDVYARWNRMLGRETFFLTGTDENGQKLIKAAEEAKEETLSYVDRQVDVFRDLCRSLKISNDDFIRTSEPRHHKVVQWLWKRLDDRGEIYQGDYEGWYCLACENFYTEMQAEDMKCPVHQSPLEKVKEKGYFFRLSKYESWIKEYIAENESFIVPNSARKEMLQRIKSDPIRDLSVSRPNAGWGIPVPGDEKYVVYTWFDALINYYTAVKDKSFWPAQVHVIGKDITWFHTIIWPAMLKAADLEIPEQIYVHGMVLGQDGRKMSKSLGNGVDPLEVIANFPIDSFRYYLLRAIPSGQDGAFVTQDLVMRHNNELANDYGNLLMRVVKLTMKKFGTEITPETVANKLNLDKLGDEMQDAMERREHHRALEKLWEKVNEINLYLNQEEPWKIKDDPGKLKEVLYNALSGIQVVGFYVKAFMPNVSQKTLESLGCPETTQADLVFGKQTFQLSEPEMIFPKIEVASADA